jgi:plasmid stabilization system protein ParE
MKRLVLLPEAAEEIHNAVSFYESCAEGLGTKFLASVARGLRFIRERPRAGTALRRGTRRHLLGRFPYGILYRMEREAIVVVAVMHLHRRPGYWADRL